MQAVRLGIYGASGTGKSTKMLALARGLSRAVLWTPFPNDYAGSGFTHVSDLAAAFRKSWRGGFRFIVQPPYGQEPAHLELTSALILKAQQATRAAVPIVFLIDELNLGFPVTALPAAMSSFGELCSRGRHFKVSMIGATQRPQEVNTRWRGNLSGFYVFRPNGARDLAAIRAELPAGVSPPAADFEYLYCSQGRAVRGQVKKP